MKTSVIWIIVAFVAVLAGWYFLSANKQYSYAPADQGQTPTQQTTSTTTTTTTTTSNTNDLMILNVKSDAKLGQYLVAANGMTLYRSSADSSGVSKCTSSVCVSNWPAYTIAAGASLPVEVSILGKVGTIVRADGSTQVTYNGMPLYFWKGDTKPGDTSGNNVKTFVVARP